MWSMSTNYFINDNLLQEVFEELKAGSEGTKKLTVGSK